MDALDKKERIQTIDTFPKLRFIEHKRKLSVKALKERVTKWYWESKPLANSVIQEK